VHLGINKDDINRHMMLILHFFQKQASLIKNFFSLNNAKYALEAIP
jgi:hypothetical protein